MTKERDLKSAFRQAFLDEFYACYLFDKEYKDHYLFRPDETGDSMWLMPIPGQDQSYQARLFKDDIKLPPQRRVVPSVWPFGHSVSYEPTHCDWKDIVNRVEEGGRRLAQKINRCFVEVLMDSVSGPPLQMQEGDPGESVARVADNLADRGFDADRFLFPKRLKNRLIRTIISHDDSIQNVHYAGTTDTGLKAFWSSELPRSTALVFDSRAGLVITQEPRYWSGKGRGFCREVGGEVGVNLIVKNTQSIAAIAIEDREVAEARVFIAYREEDAKNHLGPLQDKLSNRFGRGQVWVAKKEIGAAKQWLDEIKRKVKWCNIMLVLVGPHWLNATDDRGRPKLDKAEDIHRREIACALTLGKVLVAVPLEETAMPSKSKLPQTIWGLLDRQAAPIRLGAATWGHDTDNLIKGLTDELRKSRAGTT